jgi:hypothetical protein
MDRELNCEKCSEEMQKLCATYPASYSCGEDAVAYRAEMRKLSGETVRDLLSQEVKSNG